MTIDARFYHLTRTPLSQVLPVLLQRVLTRGQTAAVLSPSQDDLGRLDDLLWSFRPESFLPHRVLEPGQTADGDPIVLTGDKTACVGRDVLFFLHGFPPDLTDLEPTIAAILFDAPAVQTARAQWKQMSANDTLTLTYWQQTERGGWEKKA